MISTTVHALVAAQAKMGHGISESQGIAADASNERASAAKERAIKEQVDAAEDRADAALTQALVSIGVSIAGTVLSVATAGAASPTACATQATVELGAGAAAQKIAERAVQIALEESIEHAVTQGAIQAVGIAAGQIPKYFWDKAAAENDIAAARQEALADKCAQQRDQSQKLADETRQSIQQQIDAAIAQSNRMLDTTKYV